MLQAVTFLELLYFVVTCTIAFYAARWGYLREGWMLAIITFAFVWELFLWFFFTGRFSRLVGFFLRPPKAKDRDSNQGTTKNRRSTREDQ